MNTYYDYLFSTAYIQTAVSKLLETQAKKISMLTEKGLPAEQIGELNRTLKEQLRRLEYLHLLLYNKTLLLLNALEVRESGETEADNIACHKTARSGHTYGYILNCKCQNAVGNPHDPYRGGYAALDAYASIPKPKKGNFLSYSVAKGSKMLDLFSQPAGMKTEVWFGAGHVCAKISGAGSAMLKEGAKQRFQTCEYILDVVADDISFAKTACRMRVFSADAGIVLHDSGLIDCAASLLDLHI